MPSWYPLLRACDRLRCTPWEMDPTQGTPRLRKLWQYRALAAERGEALAEKRRR